MPILSANNLDFISRSAEQTRRMGMRLGAILKVGEVVGLSGDLGSGKTTFIQGLARGWGAVDPVSSPTFVLENQYRRADGLILHHLDAYRIQSAREAEDLDLDTMIASGNLVVEWFERIAEVFSEEYLHIQLTWIAEEQRDMLFTPYGERYIKLLEEFKRQAFGG